MLHFNRKIYLIPNWPFHLWFGNHVVSFRFIKANISLVMKGCFKLSRHYYICSSSCLKILFHLNICLIQITKYNSFPFNLSKVEFSISITNVSSVWTRKIKRLFLPNFLSNTIFFRGTCSYNQLLCCWLLWLQRSEIKQKVQPRFTSFISDM